MIVSKLVATGNDFIFADGAECSTLSNEQKVSLVRILCDRHFGIGADGMVFVDRMDEAPQWKWDFYNSDGSIAEMCGNATRCFGRWAERKMGLSKIDFLTLKGVVSVRMQNENVESKFRAQLESPEEITFQLGQEKKKAFAINTGVPHAVVIVNDLEDPSIYKSEILSLRFHRFFDNNGANVTLVKKIDDSNFQTVTFERGVENFTLSCGTGVLAAAWVAIHSIGKNAIGSQAHLNTPGGSLSVEFLSDHFLLRGPAQLLFEVSLDIDSILKTGVMG